MGYATKIKVLATHATGHDIVSTHFPPLSGSRINFKLTLNNHIPSKMIRNYLFIPKLSKATPLKFENG